MDRLASKRKRLIISLLQTNVTLDHELILLHNRAEMLIKNALAKYPFIGALDDVIRADACSEIVAMFEELTSFLIPGRMLHMHDMHFNMPSCIQPIKKGLHSSPAGYGMGSVIL